MGKREGEADGIMGLIIWGRIVFTGNEIEALRLFVYLKKKEKILTKSPMAQRVSRQVQTAG